MSCTPYKNLQGLRCFSVYIYLTQPFGHVLSHLEHQVSHTPHKRNRSVMPPLPRVISQHWNVACNTLKLLSDGGAFRTAEELCRRNIIQKPLKGRTTHFQPA